MEAVEFKNSLVGAFPEISKFKRIIKGIYEKMLHLIKYMPGSSITWGPPRGTYEDVITYNSQNPNRPFRELLIKKAKADTYQVPVSNSKIVTAFFKSGENTEVIEKKAWFLKDVRYVYGHSGSIITADDRIFLPLSQPNTFRTYKNHQLFYRFKLPKMAKFKKVILVDTYKADENNYCHWMRDHLSRFFWLKQLNINFSDYTLIATNGTASFCEDTRVTLVENGFNFKEWMFTHDFPHLYAEEIIIPPYVNFDFQYGIFDMDEILFLRRFWLKPATSNFLPLYDKIYLSRRKAVRRYTPVQAELADKLAHYNVKEVFLEDFTVFEQATIVNNASLIIGLHGAALTNLIFCRRGTTVIEIFGPDQMLSHFWSISNKLKLNYYAYCDDEFKGKNPYPWRHMAPTHVNIESFFNFFSKLNVL